MLKAFLTFLNEYPLHLDQQPTLLAVSGGVDSMVLATLFHQNKFPFAIAHANFNLRGEESEEDEKFVVAWAEAREITVHVRHFDTLTVKKDRRISTQMAARQLRYDWFEALRTSHDYTYLATAHHADDAIETFLLNFTRGTGLAGLPGIAPVRGYLIRPLLLAAKSDIMDFARKNDVLFRGDSSNKSTHYRRNLLRHEVLPVLQKINPSLEKTFRDTAERLRAANHLLDDLLHTWQQKYQHQQGNKLHISIEAVQNASEPAYYLHYCLEPLGFSYRQTRQIVSTIGKLSGKQFFSASHHLVVDRTALIVEKIDARPTSVPFSILEDTQRILISEGEILTISQEEELPDFSMIPPTLAYFDARTVNFPLTVRPWQAGDWFCPLGMDGRRKKVSDLLIDRKILVSDKKNVLVLTDNDGQIIWVLGFRTDHRFRIQSNVPKFLKFSIGPAIKN